MGCWVGVSDGREDGCGCRGLRYSWGLGWDRRVYGGGGRDRTGLKGRGECGCERRVECERFVGWVEGMVGWVGGSAGSGLGPFQPVKGGLGGHLSPDHARESNLSKVRFPCLMFSEQADAKHALQESGKNVLEKKCPCVWAECCI